VTAEGETQQLKGETKPTALMVPLKYETNAELLGAYFTAIEHGKLT